MISFDNFFKDKKGKTVIIQKPNYLILITLLFFIVQLFSTGVVEQISFWGVRVTLLIWSLDELFRGDSPFRQALGLFVGLILLFGLLTKTFI